MGTLNHLEIQSTNKMDKVEFGLGSTASWIQSVVYSKLHWAGRVVEGKGVETYFMHFLIKKNKPKRTQTPASTVPWNKLSVSILSYTFVSHTGDFRCLQMDRNILTKQSTLHSIIKDWAVYWGDIHYCSKLNSCC